MTVKLLILSGQEPWINNFYNLNLLPVRLHMVDKMRASLVQGEVELATLNEFISLQGHQYVAFWLLNQATDFWKAGQFGVTLSALTYIEKWKFEEYLSINDKNRAAMLWTSLVTSQASLLPEEQLFRLDKALALNPNFPDAIALKGITLANLGDRQSGKALLMQALSIVTEKETDINPNGQYYIKSGVNKKAGEEGWIWMRLGQYYLNVEGDFAEAENALKKSLLLYPENEWANDFMVTLFVRQELYSDALPYAQKAVSLNRNIPEFWRKLGDIYWFLGEKEEAVKIYEQLIQSDPSFSSLLADRIEKFR